MAVNTIYAPIEQAGNSVTVAFNFAFKIQATTDLVVRKKAANGTYSAVLTLGVDYTATFDPVAETGTVTYTVAPVTGGASNIQRVSDKTQATVYPREGPFPAKTNENVVDKLTLLVQELIDRIATRAPLYPAVPLAPAQLIIKPVTDRRALVASTNGDGTFNLVPSTFDPDTQATLAAASAAAALVSQNAAAVSAAAASNVAQTLSGLYAARPVAPALRTEYYSTDRDSLELWIPAANRWFLIG